MSKYEVETFFPMKGDWKSREEKVFHVADDFDASLSHSSTEFGERITSFIVNSKHRAHEFIRSLAHCGVDARMSRVDSYETVQEE